MKIGFLAIKSALAVGVFLLSFLAIADSSSKAFKDDLDLLSTITQPIVDLHLKNKMPSGPYKGEAIDVAEKRPTIVLHDDGQRWIIANFHHQDKMYFASIPVNDVDKVFFQLVKFHPLAAHSMLRFKMKEGKQISLLAEVPEVEEFEKGIRHKPLKKPILLNDAVLSVEATWTLGRDGYTVPRGLKGHYVNTLRMVSLSTRAMTYYRDDTVPTEQYLLNFTPEESSEILKESIRTSDNQGQSVGYNLFTRNCTTQIFDIFDKVLEKFRGRDNVKGAKQRAYRILNSSLGFIRFYPLLSKYAIKWAGFSTGNARVVNLELEPEIQDIYRLEEERLRLNREEALKLKQAMCLKVYAPI